VTPPQRTALDEWVLATSPRAIAYATGLLRNRTEAEDIVQDCYCRLIAKADVYDLPNDGLKLLLTAISNACINLRTRRKRFWSLSPTDDDDRSTDPPAKLPSPDETAVGNELHRRIESAMLSLPVPQRAALHLKSIGHTQGEIAEILGVTSNNAGVLIHRARQTMAQLLSIDEGIAQ
jgi:RNA polymerase sigma factor (sigma-70 family)